MLRKALAVMAALLGVVTSSCARTTRNAEPILSLNDAYLDATRRATAANVEPLIQFVRERAFEWNGFWVPVDMTKANSGGVGCPLPRNLDSLDRLSTLSICAKERRHNACPSSTRFGIDGVIEFQAASKDPSYSVECLVFSAMYVLAQRRSVPLRAAYLRESDLAAEKERDQREERQGRERDCALGQGRVECACAPMMKDDGHPDATAGTVTPAPAVRPGGNRADQ